MILDIFLCVLAYIYIGFTVHLACEIHDQKILTKEELRDQDYISMDLVTDVIIWPFMVLVIILFGLFPKILKSLYKLFVLTIFSFAALFKGEDKEEKDETN